MSKREELERTEELRRRLLAKGHPKLAEGVYNRGSEIYRELLIEHALERFNEEEKEEG